MRFSFIAILLLATVVSCSKKEHRDADIVPQPVIDTLDTSFLSLGTIGEVKGTSTLPANENIIILEENQSIQFLDRNRGLINITNFDASLLDDEKIIIGNETDQLLLKVEEVNGQQITVSQGNIAQLASTDKTTISYSATPDIDFSTIAQPTMEVISTTPITEEDSNGSGITVGDITTGGDQKNNLINFKNYKLVKGDDSSIIELVGKRLNTTGIDIDLEKNGDFQIEIEEGRLQFIPTFRGDFELGFFQVKKLESSIDAIIKYRFKIKITTDGKLSGKVGFPLFKDLTFPIRIQAGYVPVYAEVKIEFPAGLNFDINGDGTYSFVVESEYAFTSQITYDPENKKDTKSYSDYIVKERSFDGNQTQNNYQFELFVEPKISTNLYKVLGPFANIHTGLQADVKYPLPMGEEDLFFNFNGQVGIQVLDPIWEETIMEAQSPTLFNINRGWDILGPKQDIERSDGNLKNIDLQIDSLGSDNCVGINLKPNSVDRLTRVSIYKNPQFGNLILDEQFNLNGKVKYCPPPNIEGRDSFQIRYSSKGKLSNPAQITLNLGDQAKRQASEIAFSRSQTSHTSRGPVQLVVDNDLYTKPRIISRGPAPSAPTPETKEEIIYQDFTGPTNPRDYHQSFMELEIFLKENPTYNINLTSKFFSPYPVTLPLKEDIGKKYGVCKLKSAKFDLELLKYVSKRHYSNFLREDIKHTLERLYLLRNTKNRVSFLGIKVEKGTATLTIKLDDFLGRPSFDYDEEMFGEQDGSKDIYHAEFDCNQGQNIHYLLNKYHDSPKKVLAAIQRDESVELTPEQVRSLFGSYNSELRRSESFFTFDLREAERRILEKK